MNDQPAQLVQPSVVSVAHRILFVEKGPNADVAISPAHFFYVSGSNIRGRIITYRLFCWWTACEFFLLLVD